MARQLTGREKFWVGVLIVIGVGGVVYLMQGEGGLFRNQDAAEADDDGAPGDPPHVLTELLDASAEGYDPGGRDLFKYYTPPPPKPPPRAEPDVRPPPRPVTPVAPPEPKQPVPQGPPPPDFQYIGYLGPKDDPIAVFQRGSATFQHQQGELIEGRFRVEEFGYRSVVLAYLEPRWEGQTAELRMDR